MSELLLYFMFITENWDEDNNISWGMCVFKLPR